MDPAWVAAIGAVLATVLLPLLQDRARRREKREDWARQDQVAAAAAESSRKLLAATAESSDKLDVIHTLTNSAYLAALQAELAALEGQVALTREVIALKREAGKRLSKTSAGVLKTLEVRIAALREQVKERQASQAATSSAP